MALTREQAIEACDAARAANERNVLSPGRWQCWGCMKWGGEPEKRCMHTDEGGWDACPQVNRAAAGMRFA